MSDFSDKQKNSKKKSTRNLENRDWVDYLVSIRPSENQLAWQKLEFTAFFHYGINSFTDREWGDGTENPAVFNPQGLDTDGWCESLLLAGIKGCIITAKHHDGFCLWDTKYTDHSVMNSPFKKDIVAYLSRSCRKYGIKMGIYVSPWDRHEKTYGSGKEYDDYFCNQLTELLTNYGELYTVWFDGACGEGANGKKQVYDWDRYYALIRKFQPNAVISVSGPDVRWCGNEAGKCREAEWSVVPASLFSQEKIAGESQQEDSPAFRERKIDVQSEDLGSRETICGAKRLIWYPAEVDTSIRPGWFYHEKEDEKVRPLGDLIDVYMKSVGGNSVLLLNIPPHKDGYITEFDRKRLEEIGDYLKNAFNNPLLPEKVTASSHKGANVPENVFLNNEGFWESEENQGEESLVFTLPKKENIGYIVLAEDISQSQRVENFTVFADDKEVFKGKTVGYKKIIPLDKVSAREIKILFTKFRKSVILKNVTVYK